MSINKVILIGNLGTDPELRYTQSGQAVTTLAIATTESWGSGTDRQEKTEWHRVVFWARKAEVIAEYFKKGSKIYVEGKLQTRKWQDNNGSDKYTVEIIGREFQFLDSKKSRYEDHEQSEFSLKDSSQDFDDDDVPF